MKKTDETITKAQIVEWKEKYGKIYKTTIGDEDFIWRTVRRKEYVELVKSNAALAEGEQDLLALQDELFYRRQEEVVLTSILMPAPDEMKNLIEEQGGLASALSDEIMEKSGFVKPDTSAL